PNTSPGRIAKETPSTTHRSPPARRYSTRRSSTVSRSVTARPQHGRGAAPATAGGAVVARIDAQARIADLIDGVVDQRQREADQAHAGPGGDEGPPRSGDEGGVVARPVEVGAPGGVA